MYVHKACNGFGSHRIANLNNILLNVRRCNRFAFDGNTSRVFHELLHHFADERREGSREHNGLNAVVNVLEQCFHVFTEAHVQHLVGLIENQHFELVELQGATVKVIQGSTRSTNQNLSTALHGSNLTGNRLTSVYRYNTEAWNELTHFQELTSYLNG